MAAGFCERNRIENRVPDFEGTNGELRGHSHDCRRMPILQSSLTALDLPARGVQSGSVSGIHRTAS